MIIVEEDWDDYDDLIDYFVTSKIPYKIIPHDKIASISTEDFMINGPYFCDTHIIQDKLSAVSLDYIIPDTYPNVFDNFYKREIIKETYINLKRHTFPFFIKSTGNDKLISGTVIKNSKELEKIWISNGVECDNNLLLYVNKNIINFRAEYRILIGNNKIYGVGFQKGEKSINPDQQFLDSLTSASCKSFYCVDVGYTDNVGSKVPESGWVIVEVNPPFSLDSFDIEMKDYVDFAVDFWSFVQSTFKATS